MLLPAAVPFTTILFTVFTCVRSDWTTALFTYWLTLSQLHLDVLQLSLSNPFPVYTVTFEVQKLVLGN
jgi:hypothetical protein